MHLILGIKGRSILFDLKSIEFPRSFPIDIMHLFFENVVPQMFKLWSNQFFKEDNLNNLSFPFILSKSFWEEIGQIMNKPIFSSTSQILHAKQVILFYLMYYLRLSI